MYEVAVASMTIAGPANCAPGASESRSMSSNSHQSSFANE